VGFRFGKPPLSVIVYVLPTAAPPLEGMNGLFSYPESGEFAKNYNLIFNKLAKVEQNI